MDVVAAAATVVGLVFNFATVIKTCNDIRGRYKDAEKTIGSIRHELETLQGALQELANIMMNDPSSLTSRWDTKKTLPRTFESALRGFKRTINELQDDMEPLQSNIRPGKMEKVKFLWNEDGMKGHLAQLRAQSGALQLLLAVLNASTMSDFMNVLNNFKAALIQQSISSDNGSKGEQEALPAYVNELESANMLDDEEDLLDFDVLVPTPTPATSSTQLSFEDTAHPIMDTNQGRTNDSGRQTPAAETPSSTDARAKSPAIIPELVSLVIDESASLAASGILENPGNASSRQPNSGKAATTSTSNSYDDYDPRTSPPALIRAVYRGDIEGVKELLAAGNDIEAFHPANHRTAAIVAAFLGDSKLLQVLLDRGAFVAATDNNKRTPLHFAASEGWLACVNILLSHDAPTDCNDLTNSLPLHLALANSREDVAKVLLARQPKPLSLVNGIRRNVLHLAVYNENIGLVKHILGLTEIKEHGKDCVQKAATEPSPSSECPCPLGYPGIDQEDSFGNTALQIALIIGAPAAAIISSLLKAQPTAVDVPQRRYPWTQKKVSLNTPIRWHRPLHYAILSRPELVEVLLGSGAGVDLLDCDSQSPLELAIHNQNKDATTILLARGADYMKTCTKHGKLSLLEEAVHDFSPSILDDLVTSRPDLDFSTSKAAEHVLHKAQLCGRWQAVRTLVQQCTRKDQIGSILDKRETVYLALMPSSTPESVEFLEFLLRNSASVNKRSGFDHLKMQQCQDWRLPIHVVAGYSKPDMAEVLLRYGASALSGAGNGWLPVHQALRYGDKRTIQYFLERSINELEIIEQGGGPSCAQNPRYHHLMKRGLRIACKRGTFDGFELLIGIVSSLRHSVYEEISIEGFRYAVEFGRREFTEYLLKHCIYTSMTLRRIARSTNFESLESDREESLGNSLKDYEACKELLLATAQGEKSKGGSNRSRRRE